MSQYGQIATKEAISGNLLPVNEPRFPLRYIGSGPHILVFPKFWNQVKDGKDRAVFHRVSQDTSLLDKVKTYFDQWSGKAQGTTFTPTHLLIATWVNYRGTGAQWKKSSVSLRSLVIKNFGQLNFGHLNFEHLILERI